jgi:hypothetical protein
MLRPASRKTTVELRRIFFHDWPIMILVALNLAGIGLYLGVGPATQHGAGYRIIDIKAVHRLLDAGELSTHKADWFQHNEPSGKESEK